MTDDADLYTLPVDPEDGVGRRASGERVVGGRYELLVPVGAGASGTVWRGLDRATGGTVAVKVILLDTERQRVRARREATALRLARLEGVVRFLDDAVEDDRQILVMAFVEGSPFPGPGPRDWATIRPRVVQLISALAGLHTLGIVHRDLKPGNVLVDREGRVTIVDLGIAHGAAIGPPMTAAGGVIGTPRYLAPEQARGARVDGRADLYAVGVMLYEVLAGVPPYAEGDGMHALLSAKTRTGFVPLGRRAPEVPPDVGALVDRLLAADPDLRPSSAYQVIAAIGAGDAPGCLPWVGPRTTIDTVLERVRAGRSTFVGGPAGTGRRRVVAEATGVLAAEGRVVRRARPGERPLESLEPVIGAPREEAGAIGAAERRLRDWLAEGGILDAGDLGRLDRWSRALVLRVVDVGVVVGVDAGSTTVTVPPFEVEHLAQIFHGPDVVLHLREDAARILHRRTGGVAGAVARDLEGWVAARVAHWAEGRLRVDRVGLERVEAGLVSGRGAGRPIELVPPLDDLLGWIALAGESATKDVLHRASGLPTWELDAELEELDAAGAVRGLADGRLVATCAPSGLADWTEEAVTRAHRALGAALAPGVPGRILHLIAADEIGELAVEALGLARTLIAGGSATRAAVFLSLGLSRLPPDAAPELADALARELARAALHDGSTQALVSASADLRRRPEASAMPLAELLTARAALEAGRNEAAERLVGSLPVFADAEIDGYRQLVLVRCALARDPEAAMDLVRLGADDGPDTYLGRRKREWMGQARRIQGRMTEAAALQLEVARTEPDPRRRATARLNAGLALLDGDRLDEARACFDAALDAASDARFPEVEAFAHLGNRQAAYARDRTARPDPELGEAIELLGIARLRAEFALLEAAIAWRQGAVATGVQQAGRAAAAFGDAGYTRGSLLARALQRACGDLTIDGDALATTTVEMGIPSLTLQVTALLASTGWRPPAAIRAELPAETSGFRGVILDPAEAFRYLRDEGS